MHLMAKRMNLKFCCLPTARCQAPSFVDTNSAQQKTLTDFSKSDTMDLTEIIEIGLLVRAL